jgi:hypothetical protein
MTSRTVLAWARVAPPDPSPSQPKKNAPSGRIRKPTEKIATVLRKAATGWPFSKNLTARIAARLPKM